MTDLEDRLRAMLHERAGDIPAAPQYRRTRSERHRGRAGGGRLTGHVTGHIGGHLGSWPRAWLLSAAAVAILVAGLTTLLVARDGAHPKETRPAGPHPTAPAGPLTSLDLNWFRVDAVSNYEVVLRHSAVGYRELLWRRSNEAKYNSYSAIATVFAPGRFTAEQRLLVNTSPMVERGVTTYSGVAGKINGGKSGRVLVPTIAWRYASNAWVVVQLLTTSGDSAELRTLARAVHPAGAEPVTLPFTLRNAPPGTLDDINDDRSQGSLNIHFSNGSDDTTLDVTTPDTTGTFDTPGATTRLVDGLSGSVDSVSGATVPYRNGRLDLSVSGPTGNQDTAVIGRILDGLRWSGQGGSGPGIPVRSAIGR